MFEINMNDFSMSKLIKSFWIIVQIFVGVLLIMLNARTIIWDPRDYVVSLFADPDLHTATLEPVKSRVRKFVGAL